MGIDLTTNSQRLAQAEEAAITTKMAVTNQVTIESYAAAAALKKLSDLGSLPSISQDDHWNATCDIVDSVISNKLVVMTYPASRTFHLVKVGEASTNNYTLVKQTKDAEWKLQKAWLTDSNGQVIQEWPVQ